MFGALNVIGQNASDSKRPAVIESIESSSKVVVKQDPKLDKLIDDYLNKKDVTNTLVVRLTHAYPFYDLEYRRKLDTIVRFMEQQDTYLLGRTGIFRYNNADNSIEMGFQLADNFVRGHAQKSIYDYKIKHISL